MPTRRQRLIIPKKYHRSYEKPEHNAQALKRNSRGDMHHRGLLLRDRGVADPSLLIAAAMLLQARTASCSIYTLLGSNRCEIVRHKDKNLMTAFVAVALLLAVAGSYASVVLTKNIFLEDLGNVDEIL